MTGSPWTDLDTATGNKNLYLEPTVASTLTNLYSPYQASLQAIIDDRLDNTTGYFGTSANEIATCLSGAFNSCGTTLTTYTTQQLSQANAFIQTANDAATALTNRDSSA
jgi:hypothetical protein